MCVRECVFRLTLTPSQHGNTRGLHAEGFFHRYFHINFTVPDRGNTTDDHTAALTASLRRAIAPASAIGATLEVSLPKGAPTLTLLTNKTFQFTVHDLAIKAVVHSAVSEYPSIRNAKPPLEVRFNFQLDLFFRLEVDGYGNGARGRVVKMRLDGEDAENNVDVIDFADERLRSSVDMFAAATEAVRLWAAYTQRDIADMMSRIPRTFASALLLPVPIALPWPFSDVSIKDFGFHVLPHMFEVEGQLALEV